ncbi:MAG: ATP-binding cassette domain-containing protein [Candidatus Fermentibacteria bacterium]|nr:ATP-binding cassette domain-containing protein [Candidatus Fermentibacteria bacterium]
MKQPPKVLLKYLGISLGKGLPLSIDFAVLAGAMAALLGEKDSAAYTLARYAAGFSSPPAGKVVTGAEMALATSRQGRSSTGYISDTIEAPPGMTVKGCISLAVTGFGKSRSEAADLTNELIDWLDLAPLKGTQVDQLESSEAQRTSMAIAMATNPKLLIVECPVHDSLHAKLKEFSEVGNTVLFRASSLGQIPYGVERIALCDKNGICRIVRHSELAAIALGGAEITVSFYPSLARKQLENIEGIKNLVHTNGLYKFTHADTVHAITKLMLTARANSRAVIELQLSPIPPGALLKMFSPPDELQVPVDLFHGEEGF